MIFIYNNFFKKNKEPNPFIEKKISGLQSGKIIIEQSDPNSPLYSVKTFEELNMLVIF